MKTHQFQTLLFKGAVTAMAVDGEIHDEEIDEIKSIANSTGYFLDFDFESELELNLADIKANGKDSVNQYLSILSNSELSERQEIILIEVVLRIIEADDKIEPAEIKFLQLLKSKLNVHDDVLMVKFPKQIAHLTQWGNDDPAIKFDQDIVLN